MTPEQWNQTKLTNRKTDSRRHFCKSLQKEINKVSSLNPGVSVDCLVRSSPCESTREKDSSSSSESDKFIILQG